MRDGTLVLLVAWAPGIGDPTLLGWVTTLAYLVAAWFAQRVVGRTPRVLREARRERILWALLAIGLLFLGLNKQLDLQTALTELGRAVLEGSAWYAERRTLQREFVLVLGLGGLAALACVVWLARGASRNAWLATAGVAFIVVFVLVRAATFHHAEDLVGAGGSELAWDWVELVGVGLVLSAAATRYRALRGVVARRRTAGAR